MKKHIILLGTQYFLRMHAYIPMQIKQGNHKAGKVLRNMRVEVLCTIFLQTSCAYLLGFSTQLCAFHLPPHSPALLQQPPAITPAPFQVISHAFLVSVLVASSSTSELQKGSEALGKRENFATFSFILNSYLPSPQWAGSNNSCRDSLCSASDLNLLYVKIILGKCNCQASGSFSYSCKKCAFFFFHSQIFKYMWISTRGKKSQRIMTIEEKYRSSKFMYIFKVNVLISALYHSR